jgi:hypothetical protein
LDECSGRSLRAIGIATTTTPHRGREALAEPFAAFPSWFMRITCDRCGKDGMLNEAHTPRSASGTCRSASCSTHAPRRLRRSRWARRAADRHLGRQQQASAQDRRARRLSYRPTRPCWPRSTGPGAVAGKSPRGSGVRGDSMEVKREQCRLPKDQESDNAFRGRAIKRQRIQFGVCAAFSMSECRSDDPGRQKADYRDYDSASCVA